LIDFLKIIKIGHKIISKDFSSDFSRNFLTMFSGISISQIIPIIVSPIIARLYSPEEFALLALFISTGLFFTNISTLQFDKAIMLPKSNSEARIVFMLSNISVVIIALISLLLLSIFNDFFIGIMGNHNMRIWLYLVPISVLFGGLLRSYSSWHSRMKKFKLVATRNVIHSSSSSMVKLTMGLIGVSCNGLIVGSLLGKIISTIYLINDDRSYRKQKKSNICISALSAAFMRYRKFPLYTNWQHLLNVINGTGSRYIISNFYGSNILGLYSFTSGILLRPLQLIGQSLSNVFFQRIAEKYKNQNDLWASIKKVLIYLSIIGFIFFLPIIIYGEVIFGFIFGPNWAEAGKYASILSPWLFFTFVISPISSVPLVLEKNLIFSILTLSYDVIIVILFFFLGKIQTNFSETLLFVSIFGVSYSIIIIVWIRSLVKNSDRIINQVNHVSDYGVTQL